MSLEKKMKERIEACLGIEVHPEIGEGQRSPTGAPYRSFRGIFVGEGEPGRLFPTPQIAWLQFCADVADYANGMAQHYYHQPEPGEVTLYWRAPPTLYDETTDPTLMGGVAHPFAPPRYAVEARLLVSAAPLREDRPLRYDLPLEYRRPVEYGPVLSADRSTWRKLGVKATSERCNHGVPTYLPCQHCVEAGMIAAAGTTLGSM